MDAKITRSRLANLLAYDWLKILLCIGVAVAALCVFFTTVRTRPRDDQIFELYGYTGIFTGEQCSRFSNDGWKSMGVFSYDVLDCTVETFDAFETYSSTAYAARRAAGQGTVMVVSEEPCTSSETDEEGKPIESNYLAEFLKTSIYEYGTAEEELSVLLDIPSYLAECRSYLQSAFGSITAETPSEEQTERIFYARNGSDKRFKTQAQKEEGIRLESERLIKLRDDYLAVEEAISEGVLSYTPFTSVTGKTYYAALKIGGLPKLSGFMYYTTTNEAGGTVPRADSLNLVLFNKGSRQTDLKFETVSFLHWLIEEFNA